MGTCARCGSSQNLGRSHAPQKYLRKILSSFGVSPKGLIKYPKDLPKLCKECHEVYTRWEKETLVRGISAIASRHTQGHAAYLEGKELPNG